MRSHKLRITWSVACGIATVLLVVLWVRSYWRYDWISRQLAFDHNLNFASHSGELSLQKGIEYGSNIRRKPGSYLYGSDDFIETRQRTFPLRFEFTRDYDYPTIVVPNWFVASLVAAAATVPWIRWRFGLRTLLIATTLVAVILGTIVYAAK